MLAFGNSEIDPARLAPLQSIREQHADPCTPFTAFVWGYSFCFGIVQLCELGQL